MCKKGLVACRDTSREFFCYIMGILKEFLYSPQNLLTEDEILLQYYDIASSKV